MYHHEIMQDIARQRAREMRAEARAARNARLARRAREFWTERAERLAARPVQRRPRKHGAAPAR
ncbi:hypothetical protein ACQPZP_35925 [Spirillospora sp. CA-142024]|uniref:hypothetical protein n=1 Tax=Spirillospora sp. CA-142024 TaxID=3240036 RepID=UPI003D944756